MIQLTLESKLIPNGISG